MPTPREIPQQIPAPRQKLGHKSARVGQIFGANPRWCVGKMVMDEIYTYKFTCVLNSTLLSYENYSKKTCTPYFQTLVY